MRRIDKYYINMITIGLLAAYSTMETYRQRPPLPHVHTGQYIHGRRPAGGGAGRPAVPTAYKLTIPPTYSSEGLIT